MLLKMARNLADLCQTTFFSTIQATTTLSSTATQTECSGQTTSVANGFVNPPGTWLYNDNMERASDCCSFCYGVPGCNHWIYIPPYTCAYAVRSGPNEGAPTEMCPYGLGKVQILVTPQGDLVGGSGQCALGPAEIIS